MREFLQRTLGVFAGLAMLGVVAWTGHMLTIPQASGSTATVRAVTTPNSSPQAQHGLVEVVRSVTPAVVHITRPAEDRSRVGHGFRGPFQDREQWEDWMERFFGFRDRPPFPRGPEGPFNPRGPRSQGAGSGVLVSPDGYILTNNHVVEGAGQVTVTLPDKREFAGKVIGRDPKTDLAVIKVDATTLPYIPWGDSSTLQVGETVLAVGSPFGLTSTVTQGIVSGLGRGRMGITQYEDFIQTDAAINPGNSGGALVNAKGELIGINTAIFSRTGGYQGIGFAVPTAMAKPVYHSLVKTGKVVRGYLGIGIQDVTQDLADSFGLEEPTGVLVGDVKKGSPADRGGLKRGDVIIGYRGSSVEDPIALQRMVTKTLVGTESAITIVRDGKEMDLMIAVGQQPDAVKVALADREQADHVLAGLAVKDLNARTARRLGLDEDSQGVVVVDVEPSSDADRAGLSRGDVIREINREPIDSMRDFERIATNLEEGKKVLLFINRRGASLFVSVKA